MNKDYHIKEYEPQAIEAIKSRLTLEAIIKAEKIEATEEEIKAKIEEMANNYGKKPEELSEDFTGLNETFKDYIKYANDHFDYNEDYEYMLITEMCKTNDDCYYYGLRVR